MGPGFMCPTFGLARNAQDIVERLRQGIGSSSADDVVDAELAMGNGADEIERLRAALREVRSYISECDHEPAVDAIDAVLGQTAPPTGPAGDRGQVGWLGGEFDR